MIIEYAKALNAATSEIVRLHEIIEEQQHLFQLEISAVESEKHALEEQIKFLKEKLGGIKC